MTKMTGCAPGTPCRVDLTSADPEALVAFNGDLLGWEGPEQPDSTQMGGYRSAQLKATTSPGATVLHSGSSLRS